MTMPPAQSLVAVPVGDMASQRGTTLLEVLVTLIILAIGLLGLAGLQARLQASEMEAYQRAQALILLNDMASRLAANRNNGNAYVTGSGAPVGVGMDCATIGNVTVQQQDATAWCNALQGVGETLGGNNNVGAMVGGRGCVEKIVGNALTPVGEYLVTVAWQGLTPVAAPVAAVACGSGSYDGGTACVNDRCRRVVTTIVRIGDLAP
jgi:type IV pilus assembly protein PilV